MPRNSLIVGFVLRCLMLYVFIFCSLAEFLDAEETSQLEEIRNGTPAFLVRANVDRDSRVYREGEEVHITATSERDGYLYAFYQQSDGAVYQIYPNEAQPDNKIQAGQQVKLPAPSDRFKWIVSPPFGKERIKIVVSTERVEAAEGESKRQKMFSPVGGNELKSLLKELQVTKVATWAEHDISIRTRPAAAVEGSKETKRYGVFVGVSDYQFNAEMEAATEGEESLDLPTCDRDAELLGKLMREDGLLDEILVLTNKDATKEKMEQAITQWLPGVAPAGSEVFVYFSGHGMQIDDEASDEKDALDEVLVPHEFAPIPVLAELITAKEQGKLDPNREGDLKKLLRLAGLKQNSQQQPSVEQIAYNLARRTTISDDLFGRWIQALDGRKVIVLLDICHAGGFAVQEKGVTTPKVKGRFDFLDQELVRLKDIGQRDAVLLASSSVNDYSQCRVDDFPEGRGPLSVTTSYLIEAILNSTGPLTLSAVHKHCEVGMADYFQKLNPELRHEPYLFGEGETIYMVP